MTAYHQDGINRKPGTVDRSLARLVLVQRVFERHGLPAPGAMLKSCVVG